MSSQMLADNDSGAEHTAAAEGPAHIIAANWGSAKQNKEDIMECVRLAAGGEEDLHL